MSRFPPELLRTYIVRALAASGVPDADAALVADSMVEAELEGQSTHGLLRLPFFSTGCAAA